MPQTLYMYHGSPPVRAVLITAKALGITLNLQEIEFPKGQQFSPEYTKINPQHTVPTLDDNGIIIWDSHAIAAYLVAKYAKDDSLYPNDLHKRALVNQRMHFDTGVLFFFLRSMVAPILKRQRDFIPPEIIGEVRGAYDVLETFIEGRTWVAGDSVTIADFTLVTTVATLDVLVSLDPERHLKIIGWVKRAQALPCFESEVEELGIFRKMMSQYIKL